MLSVPARPAPFTFDPSHTAVLVIDMQRDFLEPGGFGESLGNDVGQLARTVGPTRRLLAGARATGIPVIHTREGHLPDLSDCPPAKLRRGAPSMRIGDPGPRGRILVRGEEGHDIVDELAPLPGEPVIDKPGKGAFYATGLGDLLSTMDIQSLVVAGVTTEVCVHTTVREANDRGYECLVLADCVGSYFPEFQRVRRSGKVPVEDPDQLVALEARVVRRDVVVPDQRRPIDGEHPPRPRMREPGDRGVELPGPGDQGTDLPFGEAFRVDVHDPTGKVVEDLPPLPVEPVPAGDVGQPGREEVQQRVYGRRPRPGRAVYPVADA
jgi:nicotinamidase-related amidase